MKKINVLVFPSGAENAINVYDSLKYNLHFELFGATSKEDHSNYIFDKSHLTVGDFNISSNSFFDSFNELIEKYKISYIIPTHDEISTFLVKNQKKVNAVVVCSPLETCEIALSKISTFEKLKDKKYIPKIYQLTDEIDYPVFIKPDIGAGGKNTHIVNEYKDLKKYLKTRKYLISEFLPGDEITVDCFTARNRKLCFIGPRTRERITSGVSFRSKNIELTKEIEEIANDLNKSFVFRGLWFFQLKKDKNGDYKLMEISVRTAGTMALYRQLGINFAALSLFNFMGYDISILSNKFSVELDRYYKSCYKVSIDYENIYLDFDDTLIVNGKVNTDLMKLIYQWLNCNKKIYLISKHETDIYEDLEKYRINKEIFEKIIIISPDEYKVNYIDKNKAIFIDNYFIERKKVLEELKIPVFDVDAIECLIETDVL